jgi:transposase
VGSESFQALEEVLMTIVGAFDVHRAQLTYDCLDTETGEISRGRVAPAHRERLRAFLTRFDAQAGVQFALEGCTGWRYGVEELPAAGITAHLADPGETRSARGRKHRAKTDRADAAHLRELLGQGRIPESWIPPGFVLDVRAVVRLYKDLLEERTDWEQRIHAILFHHRAPAVIGGLTSPRGHQQLAAADLPPAGRYAIEVALRQIERLGAETSPIHALIAAYSRRQAGCAALREGQYGIGGITSVAIWSELGDARRFSSSDDAVRHAGLDITVYSSDTHRSAGHLARHGPPVLRWAAYEAAFAATRPASPDHSYFLTVHERLGTVRALLSVARKIVRRCHHRLRELGDTAWEAVPIL